MVFLQHHFAPKVAFLIALIYLVLFGYVNRWEVELRQGDTIYYLNGTQNLLNDGWVGLQHANYLSKPPAYPLLWALSKKLTGLEYATIAMLLNLCFWAIFCYRMLYDYFPKLILFQVAFWVKIILAHELFKFNLFALAENIYIPLVAVGFWQ